MKIGIIGNGVVGNATARTYVEHHEVRVYDVIKERCLHTRDEVFECDIIFICVHEAFVEMVLRGVLPEERHRNLVIKSTVPIGTTKRLAKEYQLSNLIHSPEFLTARCAVTDAQLPARNIIGTPKVNGLAIYTAAYDVAELYEKRFPGVPILHMDSNESEAVKLFTNGFFSVKVAYFNEIYNLTNEWGMDWDIVRAGILSDGRIAHSHTTIPGPTGVGIGGVCLPKDLRTLVRQIGEAELFSNICEAAATYIKEYDQVKRGRYE